MTKDGKAIRRIVAFSLLLVLICAGVSLLTISWVGNREGWAHDDPDGHQWLREKLRLTAEEGAAIDRYDSAYRAQRKVLESEFNGQIARLAETIAENESYTPEVTAIVHDIHLVHGKLQQLSIEHYYDMLHALPPGKREKLKELAVVALSQPE
jgi:hypothetical protein